MASLATFVNRFVGVAELADAPPAVWTRTEAPRLRPIANEDVYLFVKRIDNTTVVRAADPAALRARSRTVATGFIAAMLVIAGLVPAAYNTMAGFTIENLKQEQAKLRQEQTKLEVAEAQLLNVKRLDKLANQFQMAPPEPTQELLVSGKSSAEARSNLPVKGTGSEVATR
jgi:cell division protein FtsL